MQCTAAGYYIAYLWQESCAEKNIVNFFIVITNHLRGLSLCGLVYVFQYVVIEADHYIYVKHTKDMSKRKSKNCISDNKEIRAQRKMKDVATQIHKPGISEC